MACDIHDKVASNETVEILAHRPVSLGIIIFVKDHLCKRSRDLEYEYEYEYEDILVNFKGELNTNGRKRLMTRMRNRKRGIIRFHSIGDEGAFSSCIFNNFFYSY